MTTKERLHELVDELEPEKLDAVADYIEWLNEPDELSDEMQRKVIESEAAMARGESVSLRELLAKYGE